MRKCCAYQSRPDLFLVSVQGNVAAISGSRIGGQGITTDLRVQGVTEYIPAAHSIGWDFAKGHLLPLDLGNGSRGPVPMSAKHMTSARHGRLGMTGLSYHFTMHSFRLGGSVTESLACTEVDKIIKIGGWNTESIAKHYIGSTTSTWVRASKRARDHGYARAKESPLSQNFESDLSACAPRYA